MTEPEEEYDPLEHLPTDEDVEKYEYLGPALESLYLEISKVSSKKHDALVSAYKIRVINKTLQGIKDIMGEDPAINDLDVLAEDEIPQFSDVVMLLGQFRTAMDRFEQNFYQSEGGYSKRWMTQESPPSWMVEEDEEGEDDED